MLTTSVSLGLGVAFLAIGGLNVWLVLEAWSRVKAADASRRMLTLHRVGGYLFIALFALMTYFMLVRLRGGTAEASPYVTIHLALAMLLSPLLFVKVLIARYYRNQHNLLLPIGLAIFVLACVLIASTAGPYLLRASDVEKVAVDSTQALPESIDVNQAADLMQRRCSKCHNLDRVVGARKDADGWLATVNRMRALPSADIPEADARIIVAYLDLQNRPAGSGEQAKLAVERALIDQRCSKCHGLDRVYKETKSADEWSKTVAEMVGFAAGSANAIRPGEDRKILDYLVAMQTPGSGARTAVAAGAGDTILPTVDKTAPSNGRRNAGVISLVILAAAALAIRRPAGGKRVAEAPKSKAAPTHPGAPPPAVKPPLVLRLIQSTPQTHDSKTLRFALSGDRKLDARPGQFLTFSFLFDGRRETRCYSICSSPARGGYVEITPKRMPDGCVSVYLNDRASLGLTVEATGPFGQFVFDPAAHRKIVLIAGGSGITPMIAMLRFIDDLCLDTEVRLLYCVRTPRDIIFRDELGDLESRLGNFRYDVLPASADSGWRAATGHIHSGFVRAAVPELRDRVFFLCGPPPFMDAARAILLDLGVEAARIHQEIFGGAGAAPKPATSSESGFSIELVRSGVTVPILEGQTLLEAAAAAGAAIPSACRQGQCGTCKTRLLAGSVRMSAENGLDAESKSRGLVLTCVGHAASDIRLDA